ncbi:hypothetical protein RsTz2092_10500 [Deferribacterales bacterium RsTz2092]|nr:hypothetical protein AGMMS49941_11130 [Deferribacterales bacterium]
MLNDFKELPSKAIIATIVLLILTHSTVVYAKEPPPDIYYRDYSLFESNIDWRYMVTDSELLLGASIIAVAILWQMPESYTGWGEDEKTIHGKHKQWFKHVKNGPVMDHDDWTLNYIAHPYCGALYYMGARSAGTSAPYALLYSFIVSTFFWEFGVEAFAETPSWQDIIITPLGGALVGEGFYLAKRHIVSNDYKLLGTRIIGYSVAFLIDPLTETARFFVKSKKTDEEQNVSISVISFPTFTPSGGLNGYNIMATLRF